MSNYERKHNQITLGELSFEVLSYKVNHVKTVTSYFTISGDTGMYQNGVKPYLLTLKGYFPKCSVHKVILWLETLLFTSNTLSFTLDGLSFSNVVVNNYSLKEEVSDMVQEFEISLMGLGMIQEVKSVEE